ncbi:hypothetical protein ACFC0X_25085 [Paenibacillus chitinolyticus]|uniref:hypothetical protein n=1 Tax=Paenibacillus chitinolyticus TaxID=79263 RepID=UPI0035D7B8B0
MSKWVDPKFVTVIASLIAVFINKNFGWQVSTDKLVAAIIIIGNFLVAQIAVDIQKIKNGEKITFNSTKFVTVVISCLILGFSEYLGIPINEEEVFLLTGLVATYITAKAVKDVANEKKKAADIQAEGDVIQEASHITHDDVAAMTHNEIYKRVENVHNEINTYYKLLENGNEVQSEEAARRYVMVEKILSDLQPIEREAR